MTRRDAYTQRIERFLELLAKSANVSRSARDAGISRQYVYDKLRNDPAFAERVAQAEEEAIEELEAVARERAIAGSDLLIMFLLKAAKPEKYRDKPALINNNAPQNYVIELGYQQNEHMETIEAPRLS